MTEKNDSANIMMLVTEVVASYVSHNQITPAELPAFIQQVYQSLSHADSGTSFSLKTRPEPAVSIEESIQPDYIVCFEDGLHFKMLKRHLKASYNMTPDQYRKRWGLPADYPMVAPNYSKRRSSLAKTIGLGTHRSRRPNIAA